MYPREELNQDMQADLIKRCVRGDEGAYRELLQRYEKPLINFIMQYVGRRHVAEDLFQETWVRVIRSIKRYRPTASLATWIFTIARNLCLDHIKYQKRHKTVPLEEGAGRGERDDHGRVVYFQDQIPSATHSPDEQMQNAETREQIQNVLAQLSPKKREAIILRISLSLTYEEIADIVNAPVGTVKYRVHDALNDLARKLKHRQSDFGGQSHAM